MSVEFLNPNRHFDPDIRVRNIATELYDGIKDLPIISPHGHTDPKWFAENEPFTDPTSLLIIPDHYVFRMLYSQGVPLEDMGIARCDGTAVETDSTKIWMTFARHYYLFAGTPVGVWFEHVFHEIFSIHEAFNESSAMMFYEKIDDALKTDAFRPRQILEQYNIEIISTTDDVNDDLEYHARITDLDWNRRVLPTFRPDSVTNLANPQWVANVQRLSEISGFEIATFQSFLQALAERRQYFIKRGATATDHGVATPFTHELSSSEAENLFQKALMGNVDAQDIRQFSGHMLMEMARMSIDDGLVMQIHPGVYRNHNQQLFHKFGADKGADIPIQVEYTKNLHPLLNKYGNHPRLKLIVFTLDETTYARELAPLAGHYPALRLGPAWWFNDSIEGMTRFRQMTTETASFYNTVGFNDDTRALLSIPARHDLSRRVDSNFLAGLVASHRIGLNTARELSHALAYDLAKSAYNL